KWKLPRLTEKCIHHIGTMSSCIVAFFPPHRLQSLVARFAPHSVVQYPALLSALAEPCHHDVTLLDQPLHRVSVVSPDSLFTLCVKRIDGDDGTAPRYLPRVVRPQCRAHPNHCFG